MLIAQSPQRHESSQDASVNFVWQLNEKEAIEARFVRRVDDYFIVYLSSHTGCNQACRFCHLTATKQTEMREATLEDFLIQVDTVLDYYDKEVAQGRQKKARLIHFNWMARGEPLLNSTVTNIKSGLFEALRWRAKRRKLEPFFNVSSILPKECDLAQLHDWPSVEGLRLYYSLYSLDEHFRKRWIPKSHAPESVGKTLAQWQDDGMEVVFHWAMIEGQNDRPQDIEAIGQYIKTYGLNVRFNLVRYNPYSEAQGKEPEEGVLLERFEQLQHYVNTSSRIVPRVGFDIKASCGMFVNAQH